MIALLSLIVSCLNPINDPPLSYLLRFDRNGAEPGGALESPFMLAPDFTLERVGDRIVLPGSGTLANGTLFFQSWNTRSGGSGVSYLPGSTMVMPARDVMLYAQWGDVGVFAGGDGTELTPFLVATADHLNNVRNHLGAHFLQVADIDLGVAPWNQSEGWLPIGNNGAPFTGTFDGAGRVISGLFINRNTLGAGLFGYLGGATVANVRLTDVSISNSGNNTGALAGAQQLPISTITQVSASGTVDSLGVNTGGLIGYADGVMLSESGASVTVTGDRNVGGLMGSLNSGEIRNSYATGSVAGTGAEGRIGGLVGNKTGGEVIRSYAAGPVTGIVGSPKGGLVGVNSGAITAAFYDRYTSGQDDVGKGTPLPTAEMLGPTGFPGWDFVAVWAVQEGSSYPYLRWQDAGAIPYPRTAFSLRNPGPAGGPVFLDRGSYIDGWRYMEATAGDLGFALWSSTLTLFGATGTAIGDGTDNTSLIILGLGAQTGMAAQLANDHAEGGFDDWFLPSIGEFAQMDTALHPVTDFAIQAAPYWSSSETDNIQAKIWNFLSRNEADVTKNTATYAVRGARRF